MGNSLSDLCDYIIKEIEEAFKDYPALSIGIGALAAILVILALPEEIAAAIVSVIAVLVEETITWLDALVGEVSEAGLKEGTETLIKAFCDSAHN